MRGDEYRVSGREFLESAQNTANVQEKTVLTDLGLAFLRLADVADENRATDLGLVSPGR